MCNVFGSSLPPYPYNPSPDPLPLFLRYQLYVISFLKDLFVCTCVRVCVYRHTRTTKRGYMQLFMHVEAQFVMWDLNSCPSSVDQSTTDPSLQA